MLFSLAIMFMAFTMGLIAIAVVLFIMGVAGAPGAIIFDIGKRQKKSILKIIGFISTAIGQIYVVGAYSVFVVGFLRWFKTDRLDMPIWPLWIAALFHSIAAPIYGMKEMPKEPTTQHFSLGIVVVCVTAIFFFVVFVPNTLSPIYRWVPFFPKYLNVDSKRDRNIEQSHPTNDKEFCKIAIMSVIKAHNMQIDDSGKTIQLTLEEEKIMKSLIQSGIGYAESVSVSFLNSVHPDLQKQFREHFIKGARTYLDGIESNNVKEQLEGITLLQNWEVYRIENRDLLYDSIIK